jgi:Fe2+ or Zn2+ uptake regulation protein
MLDSLITSKTRIKLLTKFFINSNTTAYLRNLAAEFGESTNSIRQELNRFEDANMLESKTVQNKKMYRANTNHPYFQDLHHLLLKYVGIDQIVDELVKRIGHLEQAYITNDFAQGKPGKILDMVLAGHDFDDAYINLLVRKAEANVSFKIRYITVEPDELPLYIQDKAKSLLIWSAE